MTQVVIHAEIGFGAQSVKQWQHDRDQRALLRSHQDAEETRGPQPKRKRRGPRSRIIDEDISNAQLEGERKRSDFAGIEVAQPGHGVGDAMWRGHSDKCRKAQAAKARIDMGESLELCLHNRRREHASEQLPQQSLFAEPGEIEDNRSVRDDDHVPAISSHAAKS